MDAGRLLREHGEAEGGPQHLSAALALGAVDGERVGHVVTR
jgi:hypothetical protein